MLSHDKSRDREDKGDREIRKISGNHGMMKVKDHGSDHEKGNKEKGNEIGLVVTLPPFYDGNSGDIWSSSSVRWQKTRVDRVI